MDQQEKDALEFFEEFMEKEQAEEALDTSHITKREGRITCNISPSNLLCLAEPRVDLDNLSQNGFNLNEEIHLQSWEKFFTMLNGPTYGALVKEFWKMAECDRHHIVSHVSGKRVIITKKTIGDLLGLDHREGIRIGGRNEKDEFISNVIDKEIFIDLDPTKPTSEYKSISLVPKLRIWYQILTNCINPKPLNLISENLNADQKYFLYHLKNKDKLCLPAILFLHLKHSIQNSRTTADKDEEKIKYIPLGRLISAILVENGIIEHLREEEALNSIDLTQGFGDTFNGKNLKEMEVIKDILTEPPSETEEIILKRRHITNDLPPFTKEEPFEATAEFVRMQVEDGKNMSCFSYDMLSDTMEEIYGGKKKKKKSAERDMANKRKDDA